MKESFKRIILIFMFFGLVVLLFACKDPIVSDKLITLQSIGPGATTLDGGGTYQMGEQVMVTATVTAPYQFLFWKEGDAIVCYEATYSFTAVSNRTLVAYVNDPTASVVITIQSDPQEGGISLVNGNSIATVDVGSSINLFAAEASGYEFVNFTRLNNDSIISENQVFLYGPVSSNMHLVAHYQKIYHEVQVTALFDDITTLTGGGNYLHGSDVNISASAPDEWIFLGWYEGAVKVSDSESYTFTVDADKTYQARYQYPFAGGNGTENDPYLMESRTHLEHMRYYPSAWYQQIEDIDLTYATWTPLFKPDANNPQSAFLGTYDGDGCKITRIAINGTQSQSDFGVYGFMSVVADGAEIKNLTFEGFQISSNGTAGVVCGINHGIVKNITVRGGGSFFKVVGDDSSRESSAGGITGYNYAIVDTCTADLVSFTTDAEEGEGWVFGPVGGITGTNGKGTVTGCRFPYITIDLPEGTQMGGSIGLMRGGILEKSEGSHIRIEGKEKLGGMIGEMSGYNYDWSNLDIPKVDDCVLTGDVEIQASHGIIGGVVGYQLAGGLSLVSLADTSGSNKITGYLAGGIVGQVSSYQTVHPASVEKCRVDGLSLFVTGSVGGVGGIVGIAEEDGSLVSQCYAIDVVIDKETSQEDLCLSHIGGVVGKVNEDVVVRDCRSDTRLTAYQFGGGIVGSNYGTIQNCFATGGVLLCEGLEPNPETFTVDHVGPCVGNSNGTLSGMFYNDETTLRRSNSLGTPLSSVACAIQGNFSSFDFPPWSMGSGGPYPLF